MKKMVVDGVCAARDVAVFTKGTIMEESLPSRLLRTSEGKDYGVIVTFGEELSLWRARFLLLPEFFYKKSTLINIRVLRLEWLGTESNRRHTDFQSVALPTELPSRENDRRRCLTTKPILP